MPPPPDAPLIAPELFGLSNGNGHEPGVPIDFMSEQGPTPPPPPASQAANDSAVPSSGDRASIPALGPPANNLEDTDRRARAAMPVVPFLAAAVAVLFIVGAILGTVAAKSRSSEHVVRRFVNAQMVIIALRDQSQRLAMENDRVAAQAIADAAKIKADQDAAAAKVKADADAAAAAKLKADADAAAAASAEAAASASASAAAPTPPPPTAKPKWTPPPTYKPPAPKPKATTAPKTKPTSTTKKSTKDDAPPKKAKGEKEWWEKKF